MKDNGNNRYEWWRRFLGSDPVELVLWLITGYCTASMVDIPIDGVYLVGFGVIGFLLFRRSNQEDE